MTPVGVELVEGGVRFVVSDHPDAAVLDLPDTRPLVVEARWDGTDGAEHSAVIVAEPGSATALAGLAGPVVFRTIAGRRFRVHSTRSRQVVVAVFGPRSDGNGYQGVDPSRITSLIQRAEVTVRVVEGPHDLYSKPEVLVVGPSRPTTPGFEDLAEAFVRAAERAHDPTAPNNRPGALVVVHSAGDEPISADLRNTFERHAIKVWDSRGLVDAEAAIVSALRTVIDHPERMYDLDLNTALMMLNSLALAFHSGYFHQEEVGREAGELRLFDLGEDPSDRRQRIARATFTHVRALCEYIFAGPTQSYLDAAEDPTQIDPHPREASGDDLTDETGRQPRELGWSPSGTRWPSFLSYLSWFVQQLYQYAELLSDRLGPRTLVNGYSVPSDALEACPLALGTAALPPDHDESMASSRSENGEMRLYAVERAGLPGLISALATPIVASVASVASERKVPIADSSGAPVRVEGPGAAARVQGTPPNTLAASLADHPVQAQIAEIVVTRGTGITRGSGYLVSPGWVLTACHVVQDATSIGVWLGAPPELASQEGSAVDVSRLLMIPAADLALLPVGGEADDPEVKSVLFARLDRDAGPSVPVAAAGFPRFKLRPAAGQPGALRRELHYAIGSIVSRSGAETGMYEFTVDAVPGPDPEPDRHSPWEGMSGAAVWASGRLIGVVGQHHPREGLGILAVHPIDQLFGFAYGAEMNAWRTALPQLPPVSESLWLATPPTARKIEVARARRASEAIAGFWSYTHDDNTLDDGGILELARLIKEEYSLLSGDPIDLFVDRDSIAWGD